jgi:hypothetical protein
VTHHNEFWAKVCPSSCENADEVTAIFQPLGVEHDLVLPLCSGWMLALNSSLSTLYWWIFDQTGEQDDSFREKPSLGSHEESRILIGEALTSTKARY